MLRLRPAALPRARRSEGSYDAARLFTVSSRTSRVARRATLIMLPGNRPGERRGGDLHAERHRNTLPGSPDVIRRIMSLVT